eukprot:4129191-Amphidinium_carterae.1
MGDALPPVDLGTGKTCVDVVISYSVACCLLSDGNLKCWGPNGSGQLGYGDTIPRGDNPCEMGDKLPNVDLNGATVVQVTSGSSHVCVLITAGAVKCWGYGLSGVLGQGSTDNLGDDPCEMGANLPNVDLGTGRTATQIIATTGSTCALLDDSSVKCWGRYGYYGNQGYEDLETRGTSPCTMGNNLPAVNLGDGFIPAKLTGSTASPAYCAISTTGTWKCWGVGWNGQLGYEDLNHRGDVANTMGNNLPLVNLGDGLLATEALTVGGMGCLLRRPIFGLRADRKQVYRPCQQLAVR